MIVINEIKFKLTRNLTHDCQCAATAFNAESRRSQFQCTSVNLNLSRGPSDPGWQPEMKSRWRH